MSTYAVGGRVGVFMNRKYPFFSIAFFFSLGILMREHFAVGFFLLTIVCVLLISLCLVFSGRKRFSLACLFIACVFLGALYSSNYQELPKNHIVHVAKYYYKTPVVLEGLVVSDVEQRNFFRGKKTNLTLEVQRFKTKWGWKRKTGKILVNIFRDTDIQYGDYVYLEGKMHRPFEFSADDTFSYRDYLGRKGIKLILSVKKEGPVKIVHSGRGNPLKAASLQVKNRLKAVLERNLSQNESGIMQAILLGDRYKIPKHVKKMCELAGVSHILAISGLHIGMVAFLLFLCLKMLPLPRTGQYILTMILLLFYAFMTGGRPSVVRATILAVVLLSSFLFEREADSINTLSLAAVIVLLINPSNLFDIGFQLSFLSVFFIIYFYPRIMGFFPNSRSLPLPARYLIQSMAVSISAYVGVAGLIVYYFRILTPVAILANLVVVPLTSVIVTIGVGLILAGIVFPSGAFVFAVCLKVMLNLMVGSIFLFTQIPGAYFTLPKVPFWILVGYYVLIFSVFRYRKAILGSFLIRVKEFL